MEKRGRPPLSAIDRLRSKAWAYAVMNYLEAPNLRQTADKIGMCYTTFYNVATGTRSANKWVSFVSKTTPGLESVKEIYEKGPFGSPLWAALNGDRISDHDIGRKHTDQWNEGAWESAFESSKYYRADNKRSDQLWRKLSLYIGLYWQELAIIKLRWLHYDTLIPWESLIRYSDNIFSIISDLENKIEYVFPKVTDHGSYEYGQSMSDFCISNKDILDFLPGIYALEGDVDEERIHIELKDYNISDYISFGERP